MRIAKVTGSGLNKHISVKGLENVLGLFTLYDLIFYKEEQIEPADILPRNYTRATGSSGLLAQVLSKKYKLDPKLVVKFAVLKRDRYWNVWLEEEDDEENLLPGSYIQILREKDLYHVSILNYTDSNDFNGDEGIKKLASVIWSQLSVLHYTITLPTHVCDVDKTEFDMTEMIGRINSMLETRIDPEDVVHRMAEASWDQRDKTPRAVLHESNGLRLCCSIRNVPGSCGKQHPGNEQALNEFIERGPVLYAKLHPCSKGYQRQDTVVRLSIERTAQVKGVTLPIWEQEQKDLAHSWFLGIKEALTNK